jgi:hypothetical protein
MINEARVMPGLGPGINVLRVREREGVDGRDKPGMTMGLPSLRAKRSNPLFVSWLWIASLRSQ